MVVQSYKMGPGTLKLGPAGATDVSCQVTSCVVSASESADTGDDVDLLCGEVLKGDETVSLDWTIGGNLVQDLAAAGTVGYTWTNASSWVAFEFVPNTVLGRKVTGQCRLIPLGVGGDAKSRPQSDFEWAARGAAGAGTAPVLA